MGHSPTISIFAETGLMIIMLLPSQKCRTENLHVTFCGHRVGYKSTVVYGLWSMVYGLYVRVRPHFSLETFSPIPLRSLGRVG